MTLGMVKVETNAHTFGKKRRAASRGYANDMDALVFAHDLGRSAKLVTPLMALLGQECESKFGAWHEWL